MDSAKTELADKLKAANNILVTVSRNPSVDQLAACIGLTLLLNKLGKHAAAVFSGQAPSTIEFLEPEDTLEKNTDSLRDFIIALDKSKADKLRYKVEDNVVRIFITPYRTSISQADLDFSQGDFNVDVVVALGVQRQEELDAAIMAHGRILHDAAVASINTAAAGELGTINWTDQQASSLCELVTELAQTIDVKLVDNQIATALLTGIVAETDRFSNAKTSSQTMSVSATLMAAGANQQLVATKLESAGSIAPSPGTPTANAGPLPHADDGMLAINHAANPDMPEDLGDLAKLLTPPGRDTAPNEPLPELQLPSVEPQSGSSGQPQAETPAANTPSMIMQPPALGGALNASTQLSGLDAATDPLGLGAQKTSQLLDHDHGDGPPPAAPNDILGMPAAPTPPPPPPAMPPSPPAATQPPPPPAAPAAPSQFVGGLTPPPPTWVPPSDDPFNLKSPVTDDEDKQTLTDIEQSVHSPHLAPTANVDNARDEVNRALADANAAPEPIQALNAQPLGGELHPTEQTLPPPVMPAAPPAPPSPTYAELFASPPPAAPQTTVSPVMPPPGTVPPAPTNYNPEPQVTDPNAPPPVPPPIPFQFRPPGQ